MEKRKARPGELRQQINRMRNSRDNLKNINREKALRNKKLRDRNVELTDSRDHWRTYSKELDQQLRAVQEEAKSQRMRADKAHKCASKLQDEIETMLEKKSRA